MTSKKLGSRSDCTILIDIDGVISPINSFEKDSFNIKSEWSTWSISEDVATWLYYISKVVDKVVWISSHEENSHKITEYFGIPNFEFLIFSENQDQWFKQKEIKGYIESLRESKGQSHKVILIDDETPVSFQIELQKLGVMTLVPDSRYGLLKPDIEAINGIID